LIVIIIISRLSVLVGRLCLFWGMGLSYMMVLWLLMMVLWLWVVMLVRLFMVMVVGFRLCMVVMMIGWLF
jgi:hypothetical protein